jgi:hypothetical protein
MDPHRHAPDDSAASHPPAPAPDAAPAPPTVAPPPPAPPPPAWPVVLGALAIILGGFGALGALLGAAAAVFQDTWLGLFQGMIPEEAAAEMSAGIPHQALNLALQLATLALAILLALAGLRLVRRSRRGVRLVRLWAILKIPLVLIAAVIGAQVTMAQMQAMQSTSAGGPPPGFQQSMAITSFVLALAWGCALPLFTLFWLSRSKVRAEIARWPQ